jgi:membrane protein YdbS with pleckstrin-like domain
LPFLIIWFLGLRETYEALGVASNISYPIFLTVVVTTIEIAVIVISFLAWYLPTYRIDEQEVIYDRGSLMGEKKLADSQQVGDIDIRQGPLARRFNYGTLVLRSFDGETLAKIVDVSSPRIRAEEIEALVEPPGEEAPQTSASAEELIAAGESQYVEYKASLLWDYRQQKPNKALYTPVMKNVAGFMNATGGVLLIGVADDGEVLGLEPDFSSLKRQNVDGFELAFNMAFNKMIGVEYRHFVDVTFPEVDGVVICKVDVRPATRPVYLHDKGGEQFYIRAGNGSQPLSMSQAHEYISERF